MEGTELLAATKLAVAVEVAAVQVVLVGLADLFICFITQNQEPVR